MSRTFFPNLGKVKWEGNYVYLVEHTPEGHLYIQGRASSWKFSAGGGLGGVY